MCFNSIHHIENFDQFVNIKLALQRQKFIVNLNHIKKRFKVISVTAGRMNKDLINLLVLISEEGSLMIY